jgi:hypothetical protein
MPACSRMASEVTSRVRVARNAGMSTGIRCRVALSAEPSRSRRWSGNSPETATGTVALSHPAFSPPQILRWTRSYTAAQYRRIAARRGAKRATVAIAHTIIVAAWHMLTNATTYHDLGADYFLTRANPDRRRHRLITQLHALSFEVTLIPRVEPTGVAFVDCGSGRMVR